MHTHKATSVMVQTGPPWDLAQFTKQISFFFWQWHLKMCPLISWMWPSLVQWFIIYCTHSGNRLQLQRPIYYTGIYERGQDRKTHSQVYTGRTKRRLSWLLCKHLWIVRIKSWKTCQFILLVKTGANKCENMRKNSSSTLSELWNFMLVSPPIVWEIIYGPGWWKTFRWLCISYFFFPLQFSPQFLPICQFLPQTGRMKARSLLTMLLMLRLNTAWHMYRKVIPAIFHIHELTDWQPLTGQIVIPPREHELPAIDGIVFAEIQTCDLLILCCAQYCNICTYFIYIFTIFYPGTPAFLLLAVILNH